MEPSPLDLAVMEDLPARPAAESVRRLVALREALRSVGDPRRLAEVAGGLPSSVAGLPPEVIHALQELAMSVLTHGPTIPEDLDRLEPGPRAGWLRVALATGDGGRPGRIDDALLLALTDGWSPDELIDVRPLLERMLGAKDVRLRQRGLEWSRAAVIGLALTPADAGAVVVARGRDAEPSVRRAAISMLAEGWASMLTPAVERRRDRLLEEALDDAESMVARAAVSTAASLGRGDWLRARVEGEGTPATTRAEVIGALGAVARDGDLEPVLAAAEVEPLRFGPAVRTFLLAAHRHGVFVREPHLPAVLACFDAHAAWTVEELVRITHIVRHALVEHLTTLPADDPRWIRRAGLLTASVGTDAPRVLSDQLARATELGVADALCEAAGACVDFEDEDALLAWLDALPETVIPILAVKGGARAEARLRRIVEDPSSSRAHRGLAMDALWALCRDRDALLHELSARLGPHDSGLLDRSRPVPRDRRIARILDEAPWSDQPEHEVEPRRRFEVLCESGDVARLPSVVAAFRQLVVDAVQRALAGDFTVKRIVLPELEQQLFRYGRLLVAHGRHVRRAVDRGPETGRDLVLRVVVEWLTESPEPEPAVMVALLEIAARHAPTGGMLRAIEGLWRHRHREVRRAAIEALVAAGEQARGLELSLGRLADDAEPRLMVQALAAVRELEAAWAEPRVLVALDHPPMAVKKAAAEALVGIATARAVPTVVEWLAHHDNPGLRQSLLGALGRAAGPARTAVLVAALREEPQTRRVELLWDALSGTITLAAAVRLARSAEPEHAQLLDACLGGRVRLADARPSRLARELHRASARAIEPKDDPGWRLRVRGFSPDAAWALVAQRAPEREAAVLETVRPSIADWIAWLREAGPTAEPGALALVLDAATSAHHEHVEAMLDLVEAEGEAADPAAVAGMLERCIAGAGRARHLEVRAIACLRSLPPSPSLGGARRWRLLGRLGAVRGHDDLWACLEECRLHPGATTEIVSVLGDALRIPSQRDDEPEVITSLRDGSRRFATRSEAERRRWLATALAQRPLGLPVVDPPEPPKKPPFRPSSALDLEALLRSLDGEDEEARHRAAARLLEWADARSAWPRVLEAFLDGRIEIEPAYLRRLAPLLLAWPREPPRQARADRLWPHLAPWRRRVFVRAWAERWEAGDASMDARLRSIDQALLVPLVLERAEQGDATLARVLRPNRSLPIRTVLERLGERFGDDVAHLRPQEREDEPVQQASVDPLAGLDLDGLMELLGGKGVARGLAVRAVHAMVEHGERAIEPLSALVTDRRAPVRSAALRALRRVATREQSLDATARALAMETRRDVVISLMRSLGHGRHGPSLSALIERLDHRDPRLRQAAHEAIRAWGPEVAGALQRAAARARPDRRPALLELVAELRASD